ncbi:tripartite tricarboxylate transporter substrate-binding protein [Desulfovibrio cuneatus]|uniref:tripartite tricarboxylate transporter substrate-binding protein n=1 Tax=Desulfovibrio cuneatus TaxID=159728 RepID=UPI0004027373|nr:tripartite tricarboxylate transporter substrate-binding protein [Desulfovibrio cuneatus]
MAYPQHTSCSTCVASHSVCLPQQRHGVPAHSLAWVLVLFFLFFQGHAFAEEGFRLPPLSQGFFPERTVTLVLTGELEAHDTGLIPQAIAGTTSNDKERLAVVTRPGSSGALAVNTLLQKDADGYTAALIRLPDFYLHRFTEQPLYQEMEITPLLIYAGAPLALWVPENSPYQNFADLWDTLRQSQLGTFFIAGTGMDTASRMANANLNREAGAQTGFMPLASTEKALEAVTEGKAKALWAPALAPALLPGMRPLAVASKERVPLLPETPTLLEADCPVTQYVYLGIAVNANTTDVRQTELLTFLNEILGQPAFQNALLRVGFAPLRLTPEQRDALLDDQSNDAREFISNFSEQ